MLGLFAVIIASLAAASPADVADPRPAHHVVDLTGTLTIADVSAIDASAARAAANGELLVVVVPTTEGVQPRRFATTVFNRLQLDSRARNRGVILMAAIDDHKAEIVLGDGYAHDVTQETDAIMARVVVAHFKAQDARGALVAGAAAIEERVIGMASAPSAASTSTPAAVQDAGLVVAEVTPAILAAAETAAVKAVPDPRKVNGAVDGAKLLRPADQKAIAALRAAADGVELHVVTVRSLGKLPDDVFAQAVFRRFTLDSERRRGVLLLASPGRPKPHLSIVVGGGFTAAAIAGTVEELKAAWHAEVDAQPKLFPAATVRAAVGLVRLGAASDAWDARVAREEAQARDARLAQAKERAEAAAAQQQALAAQQARDARFLRSDNPIALGGGALGFVGVGLGLREVIRRRPRSCRKCNVRMQRLNEADDDAHLSAGEKAEERVGSVDYDIWSCPECGEVLKTRWGAIFSSYARCRGCAWRTMRSSSRTLYSATTSSTGLAEVTERCEHCSFHNTYTRVIPRIQQSSSSSSSSSSSGSSGSSGGGSSSGSGSSGSW